MCQCLHWQAFSLRMALGPPLSRRLLFIVVVSMIIIVCRDVPHHFQNVMWSFTLITSHEELRQWRAVCLESLPPSQDHIVLKLDLNPVWLTPGSSHSQLGLYATILFIVIVFLRDFLLAALVCFCVSFILLMAAYDSLFYLTTFLFRLFRLLSVVLFFAVINNVEGP